MVDDPTAPGHRDDPEEWCHEFAQLSEAELHYVSVAPENDEDEAPLVVLLHGFPEFWYAWRNQLSPLAEAGFRVVAPDLRGYNRSSQPDGVDSYAPEKLVGDVRELVEYLGHEQAHLVGHDWGGAITWEVAMREPEVVDRLAVLNAPHPDAYTELLKRSPEQLVKSWYIFLFQLPWLPERLLQADDYRAIDEMLTETAAPGAFTEPDVQRYKDAMARSGDMSGPINYYRAIVRATARDEVLSVLPDAVGKERTVDAPTLVIWGEQDQALSVDLLDGLDAFVPDLRIERLPDASHWVQADTPEDVTALLLDFLAE